MEKRKPHCTLERVKGLVAEGKVRASFAAYLGAEALGINDLQGMCDVVLGLSMQDFYKSMTTHANHAVWQDVYRPRTNKGLAVYLKLTVVEDMLIVSFKELGR